jgi:hypothetical protein
MLEIGTSGSVRGVDALCMAEYCDTPRSKEGSNREYKECLSIRAIVHLLDVRHEADVGKLANPAWSKLNQQTRTELCT